MASVDKPLCSFWLALHGKTIFWFLFQSTSANKLQLYRNSPFCFPPTPCIRHKCTSSPWKICFPFTHKEREERRFFLHSLLGCAGWLWLVFGQGYMLQKEHEHGQDAVEVNTGLQKSSVRIHWGHGGKRGENKGFKEDSSWNNPKGSPFWCDLRDHPLAKQYRNPWPQGHSLSRVSAPLP